MSRPALVSGATAPVAGWYGKIPALGDFASRRLPLSFVNLWDAWLQRALATSRTSLRERWQDTYLSSPIWRFTLLPGVCDSHCWAGILMPSIDKVGRGFPLTIAVALDPQPEMIATVFEANDWFAAIEQIALSSLSMDFQAVELEEQLAATPFNPHPHADHPGSEAARKLASWWAGQGPEPIVVSLPDPDSINTLLSMGAINMLSTSGLGKSLWWTTDELAGTTQLHGFSGLPPDNHFAVLLAGVASRPMSL